MQKQAKKRPIMQTFRLTRRFLPYFRPYLPVLSADLLCAAATCVCELVLPLIVRYLTDTGAQNMAELTVGRILTVGAIYLLLRILDTAASFYQTNRGHVMGAHIETDLRRDLFEHLQALSNSFYDDAKVGQLMSRITTDLNDVTEFAHHFPEEIFIAIIKIGVSFAILLATNVPLTLIIYAMLPVMLFCATRMNTQMRKSFMDSRHQLGELNAQVEDSLLGIRVVKAFAGESLEQEKFDVSSKGFLKIKHNMYLWLARFHATTRLFDGVMYVLVLVAGGLFMRAGAVSPADLVAYLLYVNMLMASVRRMVEFTEQFQRGITGIERFAQIMDEPIEIKDAPGATPIAQVSGDIRFDQVSFSYKGAGEDVLTDINLHVLPGQSIALVGPSGGGKTTLCSLIPRFYEVTGGRILLDGRDIRGITVKSLREQIGIVQQEAYLFSGSLADNIEYGRPGASRAEVMRAAQLAGASEFIEKLPAGYDTSVGERGVKLSGGQKQRVAIARVFLKNPPVLILDEATSALDNESERLVQRSLDALMKGRTVFTIAHRLTTIRNAHCILVLTDRGIEEAGTHEELMKKEGIYRSLQRTYE
ncbi:MAG: ABC transporter ATP-binding protein [Clostridia bacterium]